MSERLTMFLYLLMRDELPTGKVAKILKDVGEAFTPEMIPVVVGSHFQHYAGRHSTPEYTNKQLEAMARDYAERIAGE